MKTIRQPKIIATKGFYSESIVTKGTHPYFDQKHKGKIIKLSKVATFVKYYNIWSISVNIALFYFIYRLKKL